jgi:hypothetical protein
MRVITSSWLTVFLVFLLVSSDSLAAEVTDEIVLSRADAKCIADNVDVFLEEATDPVVVYLDICISSEQMSSLLAGHTRGDLPAILRPSASAASAVAQKPRSVTISKIILRCLKLASAAPSFPRTDPVIISGRCQ